MPDLASVAGHVEQCLDADGSTVVRRRRRALGSGAGFELVGVCEQGRQSAGVQERGISHGLLLR